MKTATAKFVAKTIAVVPFFFRPYIRKLPGLSWFQRWLLSKTLANVEVIHKIDGGPAKGLLFPVVLPDDKNFWTGTYELEFTNAVKAQVTKGGVCYDIGAWRGYFSGLMSLAGARKVYSFEPFPDNALRIQKLINLNADLDIELRQAAVGENSGHAKFGVMRETSMGKLLSSSYQADIKPSDVVSVRMLSIDSEVENNSLLPPSSMKIDVEGAEFEVLKGAVNTLKKYRPSIVMELHGRDVGARCENLLTSLGYSIVFLKVSSKTSDVYHISAHATAMC